MTWIVEVLPVHESYELHKNVNIRDLEGTSAFVFAEGSSIPLSPFSALEA